MQHLKLYSVFLLSFLLISGTVSAKSTGSVVPRLTVRQCFQTVLPNLLTGSIVQYRPKAWYEQKLAKEKELEGLNHAGVIPWVPQRRDAVNRFFVEKLGKKNPLTPPAFDKTQPLGKATVQIKDIRYSQANCRNMSQDKKFSVVNNAKAIKDGTLDIKKLPTIRVWRDTEGRIWTLDHRRLAAMHLSGAVKTLEVEFISEELAKAQVFKFGTHNEGKTIFVYQDDNPQKMSIVLKHED